MNVAQRTLDKIGRMPRGFLFTYREVSKNPEEQNAVSLILSKLKKTGEIEAFSRGIFYKPEKNGGLGFEELVKFYRKGGFFCGKSAFDFFDGVLGESEEVYISSPRKYQNIKFKGKRIIFRYDKALEARRDFKLYSMLALLENIKNDSFEKREVLSMFKLQVNKLKSHDLDRMVSFSMRFGPYFRAILGAVLDEEGDSVRVASLRRSLNSLTSYHLDLPADILPLKNRWNIK